MAPLIFTYNVNTSILLNNILEINEKSVRPGVSSISLYKLDSKNIQLNGVVLTLQVYGNTVITSTEESKSNLFVNNFTILASEGTNTIGTLSWAQQIYNPFSSTIVNVSRVPKVSTYVQSASGIFSEYLFGNIIREYDNETGGRTLFIYSSV
jgi:hypothetical protein